MKLRDALFIPSREGEIYNRSDIVDQFADYMLKMARGEEHMNERLFERMARNAAIHVAVVLCSLKPEILKHFSLAESPEAGLWQAYWQIRMRPDCPRELDFLGLLVVCLDHPDKIDGLFASADPAPLAISLLRNGRQIT